MSTLDSFEPEKSSEQQPLSKKINKYWLEYGEKLIIALSIILVAGASFQAGYLRGLKNQKGPIQMKISSDEQVKAGVEKEQSVNTSIDATKQENTALNNEGETNLADDSQNKNCPFVASKNSNKYHLSTCQWAKRIKPENRICFSSAEEAEKKGYIGAKCCIK